MATNAVGDMSVTVFQARGLGGLRTLVGKPATYCVLELDDIQIKTPTEVNTTSPLWNKTYYFPVSDITSTFVITVYDDTFITSSLGKVSIPLLMINNNERRWYVLDHDFTTPDCPRIQLKLRITWNVIKASLRTLTPRNTSYVNSDKQFDMTMIYTNLQFLRGFFRMCLQVHSFYMVLFEWDNQMRSSTALVAWIVSCYYFRAWMAPAAVILVFIYYLLKGIVFGFSPMPHPANAEDLKDNTDDDVSQGNEEQFTERLSRLKSITIATQNGIDFVVMLIQKTKNLLMFQVPFLSFIAIAYLSVVSLVLYYIPIHILFMILGLYKFTRKLYKPKSSSSHIIDFLFRVPCDQQLNDWYELKIPVHSGTSLEIKT